MIGFINSFINYLAGFIGAHVRYEPIVPPKVQAEMKRLGISYPDLYGAFYSSNIKSGYAPNATCGIANYQDKVVGAVYRRDTNNARQWVIIGCWVKYKKSRDWITNAKVSNW